MGIEAPISKYGQNHNILAVITTWGWQYGLEGLSRCAIKKSQHIW